MKSVLNGGENMEAEITLRFNGRTYEKAANIPVETGNSSQIEIIIRELTNGIKYTLLDETGKLTMK
jgi:hypothetical protein